jgi:hypothetical protein
VLAFVALGFGIVSVAVFAGLPRNSPPLARDAGLGLFLAAMLVVPVCHVVGLALGIAALVTGHDRRGLAIIGVVLNALFVFAAVLFIWAFFVNMGRFR